MRPQVEKERGREGERSKKRKPHTEKEGERSERERE
jgi:hypothetical protein